MTNEEMEREIKSLRRGMTTLGLLLVLLTFLLIKFTPFVDMVWAGIKSAP